MGSIERAGVIETMRAEAAAKLVEFGQHGDRVEGLQTEYGFDLDVAHTLYGDALLEPERGGKIADIWEDLLSSVSKNPGMPLILIAEHTARDEFDARNKKRSSFVVGVQHVELSDFVYNDSDGARYIGLRHTGILTAGISPDPRRHRLTSEVDEASPLLLVGHGADFPSGDLSMLSVGTDRTTVLWNPKGEDVASYLQMAPSQRKLRVELLDMLDQMQSNQ